MIEKCEGNYHSIVVNMDQFFHNWWWPNVFLNVTVTKIIREWRWHVTVGGCSHREIFIFCHRNRQRHLQEKYSPSPPKKTNITVTVARWRWPRFFHRRWQITVMPWKKWSWNCMERGCVSWLSRPSHDGPRQKRKRFKSKPSKWKKKRHLPPLIQLSLF